MRIRVIGVGTRRGDDAAGLLAAEALAGERWAPAVEILRCERPGPDLLDALGGVDAVVLIDAVRSGRPPGTVRRIEPGDLPRARDLSSHGLGVAESLRLAALLGRPPGRVAIVGIEGTRVAEGEPSAEVRDAIAAACRMVRDLVSRLLAGGD